ncbi:MAG: hypothetical protein C5B52_05485 [Bacteroidetes bacterium]|nr:MAG: hypothetical protein C5B52_05485 [Bacteroidota bacterium]
MLLQFSFSGLFNSFLSETLVLLVLAFFLGYFVHTLISSKREPKKIVPVKEERNPYEIQMLELTNKYQVSATNHEKSINEFKLKLQSAEDRANTFLSQHQSMKQELDAIRADSKQWTDRIGKMREEKDELFIKLQASEKNLRHFESQYEQLNSEIQAHGHAEDWHRKYNDLINEKEKSKSESQKLREMIDARDKRIIDLLSKDALAKDFRNRYEESLKENGALNARISEMENLLSKSNGLQSQLEDEHNTLQRKMALLQKESNELQERLKTIPKAQADDSKLLEAKKTLDQLIQNNSVLEMNFKSLSLERDGLLDELQKLRNSSMLSHDARSEAEKAG